MRFGHSFLTAARILAAAATRRLARGAVPTPAVGASMRADTPASSFSFFTASEMPELLGVMSPARARQAFPCHDETMPDDDMPPSASSTNATSRSSAATAARWAASSRASRCLLLTSTGAKSGAERLNLIGYFDIDGKTYVVGSAAGRDQSPGWVFNLRANPDVTVEIGADPPKSVVAHELPRDERDRIYDIIVQRAPGFGEYEERTDRVIPVFELTPDE